MFMKHLLLPHIVLLLTATMMVIVISSTSSSVAAVVEVDNSDFHLQHGGSPGHSFGPVPESTCTTFKNAYWCPTSLLCFVSESDDASRDYCRFKCVRQATAADGGGGGGGGGDGDGGGRGNNNGDNNDDDHHHPDEKDLVPCTNFTDCSTCTSLARNCGDCMFAGGVWATNKKNPRHQMCFPRQNLCDSGRFTCIDEDDQCAECDRFNRPVTCNPLFPVAVSVLAGALLLALAGIFWVVYHWHVLAAEEDAIKKEQQQQQEQDQLGLYGGGTMTNNASFVNNSSNIRASQVRASAAATRASVVAANAAAAGGGGGGETPSSHSHSFPATRSPGAGGVRRHSVAIANTSLVGPDHQRSPLRSSGAVVAMQQLTHNNNSSNNNSARDHRRPPPLFTEVPSAVAAGANLSSSSKRKQQHQHHHHHHEQGVVAPAHAAAGYVAAGGAGATTATGGAKQLKAAGWEVQPPETPESPVPVPSFCDESGTPAVKPEQLGLPAAAVAVAAQNRSWSPRNETPAEQSNEGGGTTTTTTAS